MIVQTRKAFTARLPIPLMDRLNNYVRKNKCMRYGGVLSRAKVLTVAVEEYLDRVESDGKQSSSSRRPRL